MQGKQWLLGLRIWLLAIAFNTLLGTVFLTVWGEGGFFLGDMIFMLLVFGAVYGAIVSLPAAVLLQFIINRCLAKRLTGVQVFRIALISALLIAVGAWFIFMMWMPWGTNENLAFLLIAMAAGVGATATQHAFIQRLAQYEDHQFENV